MTFFEKIFITIEREESISLLQNIDTVTNCVEDIYTHIFKMVLYLITNIGITG